MAGRIERPAILDQQPDPLLSADQKDKFALLKRTAQIDYDRALLTPGAPVGQDQLKDLAGAIARANEQIRLRGEY